MTHTHTHAYYIYIYTHTHFDDTMRSRQSYLALHQLLVPGPFTLDLGQSFVTLVAGRAVCDAVCQIRAICVGKPNAVTVIQNHGHWIVRTKVKIANYVSWNAILLVVVSKYFFLKIFTQIFGGDDLIWLAHIFSIIGWLNHQLELEFCFGSTFCDF